MAHETDATDIGPFVPEVRSTDPRWRSNASQAQREMEELRLKLRDARNAVLKPKPGPSDRVP